VDLEKQKQSLDTNKADLEKMVTIQQLQKKESEATKKTQENYLKLTEAEYQKSLLEKKEIEKRAAEIKARIFELIGVPKAPTFGEALSIAQYVESITGVRPALLMAILTQESNIGKNVGQCYVKNTETGSGVKINTGAAISKVMSPTRDVPVFLEITRDLGRNFSETPVSCPMSFGWGGAMGPAQFIPDTWNIYDKKIEEVTGKPADPWSIKDAFLAAGIYLKDLGVLNNEFRAVMKYFSGASWSKSEEFYGNSVLSIAKQYEEDIKDIQ
jgi:membrane-bound lytic murein transglycosylase B